MEFVTAHYTDAGRIKKVNQDSYALKVVKTPKGKVAFCVVCDGMGGLSKGELASKEVTLAFCEWFEEKLIPMLKTNSFSEYMLRRQWSQVVELENQRLMQYSRANKLAMGTTATAILIYEDKYYGIHVGDSRIYMITRDVDILTTDHTLVASEVETGRITKEEAKVDPRRSVLLQCIGASNVVQPEFIMGELTENSTFVLCSDGFTHEITDTEVFDNFAPSHVVDREKLSESCVDLTRLAMSRGERDNISVAVINVSIEA